MKKERTLIKYFPRGKEDIDKYFIVDEENQKVWNRKTGNELKFYPNHENYPKFSIRIDGKQIHIKVHQFFWYYRYGNLPSELDHIDRDRRNYKLDNLRPATSRQNNINSDYKKKKNTHLPKHIYKVGGKNTFFVRIAGKYIGCSISLEKAIIIRNKGYKEVLNGEELKFLSKDEFYVD